jgi:hypothetical protein
VFSRCNLQVFYLNVAYVFTHMLQLYVLNVPSASVVCCIQVFYVLEEKSHGGHARRGPVVRARSAPRTPRTGYDRPHAGSQVLPAQR